MQEITRLPIVTTRILLEQLEVEISIEKFRAKLCLLPASLLRAHYAEHGAKKNEKLLFGRKVSTKVNFAQSDLNVHGRCNYLVVSNLLLVLNNSI